MKARIWIPCLIAGLLALSVIGTCISSREEPQLPLEPTEVVAGAIEKYLFEPYYVPATVQAKSIYMWAYAMPTMGVPPTRRPDDPLYPGNHPIGIDCLTGNLDTVWPNSGTNNINWSDYDKCFTDTQSWTIKLGNSQVISVPVALNFPPEFLAFGGSGTLSDPYGRLFFPGWLMNSTYTDKFQMSGSGNWYNGIKYANLKTQIQDMITAAGSRYMADPSKHNRIAVIRIRVGYGGEPYPVYPGSFYDTLDNLLLAHEASFTTCTQYEDWLRGLVATARTAFPGKPVVLLASGQPCYQYSGQSWRKQFFEAYGTATPVGGSINTLASQRASGAAQDGMTYGNWMDYTSLRSWTQQGAPSYAEYGENPEGGNQNDAGSGGDPWREAYWANAMGVGAGADWVAFNLNWRSYISGWNLKLLDCYSNPACAMIIFREVEWPIYTWSHPNYGVADWRGDLGRQLTLLTPTAFPQSCRPGFRETAIARVTAQAGLTVYQPYPCNSTPLPTIAATVQPTPSPNATSDFNMLQRIANRQARIVPSSAQMNIQISSAWQNHGQTGSGQLELVYFDNSGGSFTIRYQRSNGTWIDANVSRTGSALWKQYVLNDQMYFAGNVSLLAGNAPLWVHSLMIKSLSSAPTATPTATHTPVNSPTPTRTPTPTNTPSYPEGIRFSEVASNVSKDYDLSGVVTSGDRWFELINWTSSTASLAGYRISNGTTTRTLPNAFIPPRAYYMFVASDTVNVPSSGTLTLYNPQLTPVATVSYPAMNQDKCYAIQGASTTWQNNVECSPGRSN